jgi:hypothetical protein
MSQTLRAWLTIATAVLAVVAGIVLIVGFSSRSPDDPRPNPGPTSTRFATGSYVGSQACAECHAKIFESYQASGMGRSLRSISAALPVEHSKPVEEFSPDNRHVYSIIHTQDGTFHHERQNDRDGKEIYDQSVKIDYVMGSGNQGRSYLFQRGDQLFMSPIGWYSRAGRWDLSPGYQLPIHERFERTVTGGCLECHTGRTNTLSFHENRFGNTPFAEESIGCERCHGPGGDHIQWHRNPAGTSKPDPIVNPAKLDPARREDVCNQCHLQGEGRYLRDGCHFGDFRPGQQLEEVYVILVNGTRATDQGQTQAVSQVEQMRSSACFQKSEGRFGCVSCHDPHSQPERHNWDSIYQEKCQNCHANQGCSLAEGIRLNRQPDNSCIACHMPRLSTLDVPHTSQTDHRILRVPKAMNGDHAGGDELPVPFDDAEQRLPRSVTDRARGIWLAEQSEFKADPQLAARAIRILALIHRQSPKDADVLNAMGIAAGVEGRTEDCLTMWKLALAIEPQRELTLRAMALLLQKLGRNAVAKPYFESYLQVQPWNALMWRRYSLLLSQLGQPEQAIQAAGKAIEIDPSHGKTYEWLSGLYDRIGDRNASQRYRELFERLNEQLP